MMKFELYLRRANRSVFGVSSRWIRSNLRYIHALISIVLISSKREPNIVKIKLIYGFQRVLFVFTLTFDVAFDVPSKL